MIDTYEFDPFFEDMNLKGEEGVFVANVYLDSPAYKGGVRPGDLITSFDGKSVSDTEELSRFISNAQIDTPLGVTVYRSGRELEFQLVLEERKSEEEIENSTDQLWPGAIVQPLNDQARESLNLSPFDKGLLFMFMGGGANTLNPFYIAGLRNYDVITKIDDEKEAEEIVFANGEVDAVITATFSRSDFTFDEEKNELEIKIKKMYSDMNDVKNQKAWPWLKIRHDSTRDKTKGLRPVVYMESAILKKNSEDTRGNVLNLDT